MSEEVAATCYYVLPRGNDKTIQGASVHLARILAQNYGNLRIAAKGTQISDKYVTAEAVCLDLETNLAIRIEVRAKILDKSGRRYNEDMINTTMLAAISKAQRNAILQVIPRGFVDEVYKTAMAKLTEPLKEQNKLNVARTNAMAWFKKNHNIEPKTILAYFERKTIEELTAEDVAELRGIRQAIVDGDLKPANAFSDASDENADGEEMQGKADRFENEEYRQEEVPNQPTPIPTPGKTPMAGMTPPVPSQPSPPAPEKKFPPIPTMTRKIISADPPPQETGSMFTDHPEEGSGPGH